MSSRAFYLLPLACLAAACTSIVNIEVDDSATFNDFEVSVPFPQQDKYRVRLRGSRIDGDYSQTLRSGERANIDGASIPGPAEFDGEYELTYWSLAFGVDETGSEMLAGDSRIASYIGISQTDFELSFEDAGRILSAADDDFELYVQYRIVYAINRSLKFAFSGAAGLSGDFDGSREYQLLLEYELFRQLVVTGGYRWFDYFYVADESDSDIELDLRGPFIGLKLPL